MTIKEVEKIERQVKGTLKHENMSPSPVTEQITRDFMMGRITKADALRKIKKYWGVKE